MKGLQLVSSEGAQFLLRAIWELLLPSNQTWLDLATPPDPSDPNLAPRLYPDVTQIFYTSQLMWQLHDGDSPLEPSNETSDSKPRNAKHRTF